LIGFTATATDPDLPANTLAFSLVGAPPGAVITSGGVFTWTPTESQDGIHTFDVVVTDDGTPNLADSETIDITVTEVNLAPVFMLVIGNQSHDEAAVVSLSTIAVDPEGNITYSATGLPPGLSIHETSGAITGTVDFSAAAASPYAVTITAHDSAALTTSYTFYWTIVEVNRPPHARPDGVTAAAGDPAGVTFSVLANDSDPDSDVLSMWTFDISTVSGSLAYNGGGSFTYIAGGASVPTEEFTYTISDGNGAFSSTTVVIYVIGSTEPPPADDPPDTDAEPTPQLVPIAPQVVDEGTELRLQMEVVDPASDADFRFGLAGAVPTGAVIDPATGRFSWTPRESQGPGTYSVRVLLVAPETGDQLDDQLLTITVKEVNRAPVLEAPDHATADPGTELAFVVRATDRDEPANQLRFSLAGNVPAGVVIDAVTGRLTWTPTADQSPGRYTFLVVVEDGALPAGSATQEVSIIVGADSIVTGRGELTSALAAFGDSGDDSLLPGQGVPIRRSLVIMGRAAFESASELGTPLLLLAVLILVVATMGRVSLYPFFRHGSVRTGIVQWFDAAAGYGFVFLDDEDSQVFLHRSAIRHRVDRDLHLGDRVEFRVLRGQHRDFATFVRRVRTP
jgi:cold shock CspA family protein